MPTITFTTTDGDDETLGGTFTESHGYDAALLVDEVSTPDLAHLIRRRVYINGGDVYECIESDDGPHAGDKLGERARFE